MKTGIAFLLLSVFGCFAQQALGVWTPTGIWTRLGVLPLNLNGYPASEEENQPGYTTTDCQYVANPCWQLTYDNGVFTFYEEAPVVDGITGGWSIPHGIILGLVQTTWIKVGQTYHMYGTDGASTRIDHYSGPSLASLSLTDSGVMAVSGSGGQFDGLHIYNPAVNWDGTVLRMIYVGQGYSYGQGGGFICGAATSYDFKTFATFGPITGPSDSCQNPGSLTHSGTNWYFWSAQGAGGITRYSTPDSAFSGSLWAKYPAFTFPANSTDELAQIADPRLVANPTGLGTYLFYEGASTSIPTWDLKIKYAWTPLSIDQLVQTSEGAINTTP